MDWNEYRDASKDAADWTLAYHDTLRDRPVRAMTQPGDILNALPASAPEQPEALQDILADLDDKILPGMTHWQHPRFFAYFPSNAAPISVLADQYANAMAAQCMLWQTSPAATELETRVCDWMRQAVGLPEGFHGVLQDGASSVTLSAVLTMRERALDWQGNQKGLSGMPRLRIYASGEVHSSIDRALWIAGLGQDNLVRIPTQGPNRAMDTEALRAAITRDRADGYLPAGVVACFGGTSFGAMDDIAAVMDVAEDEDLYTHIDAAWAGTAMICPELQHMWAGAERADSIVLNPHKWLGSGMDCSLQLLRDPSQQIKTLAIQPEYLKTHGQDGLINYSEWGISLGRRFRAMKMWFLLRAHGLSGLREMIQNHNAWSAALAKRLETLPNCKITTKPMLSLFSFALVPVWTENADALNQRFVQMVNDDGRIYLTQTRLDGALVVRFQTGGWSTQAPDLDLAFNVIAELAAAAQKAG